jgi:hypothetical protein
VTADELPPSLGGIVCDWIETYLCHGPGDVQGQPVELDDELRAFIWRAYELRPNGQRRYRRAFLSRPKGRAKSETAAMVACAELLGPVRAERKPDGSLALDADGLPVGIPVTAPEVLCIATEEDQAGFVYLAAKYMLEHGEVANAYPLDTGQTRTYLASGGSLEPVTAKASSKDGGKSTFIVADETHLWHTAELKRLHATVRRNVVKRRAGDGWMLETSTAHLPGEGSVGESSYEHAQRIEAGEVEDPVLLVDWRSAPMDVDISDEAQLRAALEEVYGAAASWTNIDGIVDEFADEETDEAENRRYWLNQVVAASDQWLSPEVVKARANPQAVKPLEDIALGFDGAKWDDSTALIGCRLKDGYLFTLGVWEKPEGPEGLGWEVPAAEVDAAVHEAFTTYRVHRFYPDPPYWQDEVASWAAEFGDDVVQAFWTHRETPMARALERLHTVMIGGGIEHDGDARLVRHFGNARKRKTRAGHVIQKEKPRSRRKIDAAVAATLAYEARADALADGALASEDRTATFY